MSRTVMLNTSSIPVAYNDIVTAAHAAAVPVKNAANWWRVFSFVSYLYDMSHARNGMPMNVILTILK